MCEAQSEPTQIRYLDYSILYSRGEEQPRCPTMSSRDAGPGCRLDGIVRQTVRELVTGRRDDSAAKTADAVGGFTPEGGTRRELSTDSVSPADGSEVVGVAGRTEALLDPAA